MTDRPGGAPPPAGRRPAGRLRRRGWREYTVRELLDSGSLEIGDGYRARNSELTNSGLPFARAGNVRNRFQFDGADCFPTENLDRVRNKASMPGDVVFTSKGTVGRFAFVREHTPRFIYSPQLCFWRALNHELIDPRFLFYWMSGREFFDQYKVVAGQTDMAEYVSLRDQRDMRATLPPVSEQRAIARVLGALDDRIELNRRMSETLEAMARALFQSWFVDFDPVRARMDGRDTGLPKEIADLFPDRLVDSRLGRIPEGWTISTLGDHLDAARGLSYKGSALSENGIAMHNLNSIHEGAVTNTADSSTTTVPARSATSRVPETSSWPIPNRDTTDGSLVTRRLCQGVTAAVSSLIICIGFEQGNHSIPSTCVICSILPPCMTP